MLFSRSVLLIYIWQKKKERKIENADVEESWLVVLFQLKNEFKLLEQLTVQSSKTPFMW